MSSPSQLGGSFGVVASFDRGISWVVAGTARLITPTGAALSRTAKRIDTTNSDGETVNVMFYDFGKSLSIQCFPRSTTLALAAAINNVDIKPGFIVKLYTAATPVQDDIIMAATSTDSGATAGTTYFVGTFMKTHEAGNKVRWDMALECPDAMTVSAVV